MTSFTKSFLPAALALIFACTLGAQPNPPPVIPVTNPDETVGPIILRDESIDQVLVLLERWTNKTIIRPQALPATTLTITLKSGVTRAEAVRMLETLLAINNIAITPLDDKSMKVVPLANAKSEAPEFIATSTLNLPPSGRVISKMFQLNFLRVAEVMPQIGSLLNPAGASPPVIFEKANAALITDSITNLQRVEILISQLDQPVLAGMQTKFYTLHSGAKASDVVNKMRTILSGSLQNQLGSATSFNPDDRTNQIVLIADPRQYPFFDDLIAKLDITADPNTRNEVIYLKHAAAKDVASILSQLVTGQNNAVKGAGQDSVRTLANPVPNSAPAAPAPANAPAVPAPTIAAVLGAIGEHSNQFSALLTILPEERSNSIVVSGTVDDIRLINDLVAKLDVLLAQVRIEVVIAEVTLGNEATSGISALGLIVQSDKLVGFSGATAGLSVTKGTVTYPGIVGSNAYDLAGEINLSTTPRKNNTTILSQPTIITTHNKEGKIFVGETRPVISGYLNDTGTTSSGLGGYRSSVNQQKIGIELTVKPLIGNDGSVQLEIKQNVQDVLGDIIIDGNPQPRVGERSTESFVSVKTGEIIVLGGLQRTSKSKTTSRLGPIPFLGDLFGTRKRSDTRTDLIFFLRPTVLTNTPADNEDALRRLELLPPKQRDPIKEAIAPAPAKP